VEHVLDGLAAAHAVGVVHRDLKPENVLIDRYRRWRLTDFGIASALGEDSSGTSGTPAFAPPEQLLGEMQGPAADTFALAAIVYYVLSGETPFGEVSGPAVLARQLEGEPALDAFRPELAEWLRRGLAADADARFADAAEMQAAWRELRAAVARADTRGGWWRRGAPRGSLGCGALQPRALGHADGLHVEELAHPDRAQLAPVAGALDAAEREPRIRRDHRVHEHAACLQPFLEPPCLGGVARPRARPQAVRRVVRDAPKTSSRAAGATRATSASTVGG
jgi:hypothetical protein